MKSITGLLRANKLRRFQLLLPLILLILVLSGVADNIVDFAGRGYIHQRAEKYLQQSEQEAKKVFLLLSATKAATALLESSEGGISFVIDVEVQLGKAFESLKKLFDYAWLASLAALTLLFLTQLLLEYSDQILYNLLLLFSLVWIAHFIFQHYQIRHRHLVERLFRSTGVGVAMLALGLPLAIFGTSIVAQSLTLSHKQQIQSGFSSHNEDIANLKETASGKAEDNEVLKQSTKTVIEKLQNERQQVQKHMASMHAYVYRHIAILLLEVVLLPLFLLWVIYMGMRSIVNEQHAKLVE